MHENEEHCILLSFVIYYYRHCLKNVTAHGLSPWGSRTDVTQIVVIKDALHDRHINDLFNKSTTIFHGLYSNKA